MNDGTFVSEAFDAFKEIKTGPQQVAWMEKYLTPEQQESFDVKLTTILEELTDGGNKANVRIIPQTGIGDFTYGTPKEHVSHVIFAQLAIDLEGSEGEAEHAIVFLFNDQGQITRLLLEGPTSIQLPSAGMN